MALRYFIVDRPELLGQALSNPYIMAAGKTDDYQRLYKDPEVAEALTQINGPHRAILSRLFASEENAKEAKRRQDRHY